jgi:hypothetical protein
MIAESKSMKYVFIVVLALALLRVPAAQAHEFIAGWEGGPGNGYGFLEPVFSFPDSGLGSAFVIRPAVSYLYYDTVDVTGTTHVTSPGASLGLAYRLSTLRLTLTLGPGFEIRQEHRELPDGSVQNDTQRGATFAADAFFQATSLTSCSLIASYGEANRYAWGRAGIKRQITNTDFRGHEALSLGLELTEQGNYDVHRDQAGGVLGWEFLKARASVQFRAGASRSRYPNGPSDTHAYFGVGFYHAY